jgi:hypothetical protein
MLPLAKLVPVLRQQVRAVEVFSDSGLLLSRAGLRLDDAASGILEPVDQRVQVSAALDTLKKVHTAMAEGVASLKKVNDKLDSIDGYNLFGPLGTAHADLAHRLPGIRQKAESAESGLRALIAFGGGSGPRRWLILSQNPDEPRPTGGFIGTYGVLTADGSTMHLDRYEAIENWTQPRPQAAVPAEQAGIVFRLQSPPVNQTLGNVNTTPDWPSAARLAMDLWQRGGEQPVDGVVTFTPGLIGRVLEVTGPVSVPDYGDVVSAANLYERLDFHTHSEAAFGLANGPRKDFVAALGQATLQRLLDSPASQWDPLARAVSAALDDQQAMAWSTDTALAPVLASHRWDGAFPATKGDFFAPGEFSYAAKNGRGLHRVYDHHVVVRPDGSAHISTTVTITNTEPPRELNQDSLSYITAYGPAGATLSDGDTDQPVLPEAELSGHPAFAWFRAAQPSGGTATLKVSWDAPEVVHKTSDGTWVYGLVFKRVADHDGDVVNVTVDLPKGWKWKGGPPPAHIDLNQDVVQTWAVKRP